MYGRRRPQMGSLKGVILRRSTGWVLMSRWSRVPWSETVAVERGESLEANPIRFGEGDPLEANPIRIGEGETPWGDSYSHRIGGPPWGESHSFWRRGLPWSESHSLWRGGAPRGESHSLGEGDPLDRGDPQEANPIMRRIPFALEKRTPMKRIHLLRRGGSPWGESIHLEKGTPLKRIPFAVERGGNPLGRIPSTWRRGPPWSETIRYGEGEPLEGDSHLSRRVPGKVLGGEIIRYGLKVTPTCLGDAYCRYIGRQERMVLDSAPWKATAMSKIAGGVSWTMTILREDESGRGWERASDGGETLGEAMTGERPPQHDSAKARLSWSHLEWRKPRTR